MRKREKKITATTNQGLELAGWAELTVQLLGPLQTRQLELTVLQLAH